MSAQRWRRGARQLIWIVAWFALGTFLSLLTGPASAATRNLLANPDLIKGAGNSPDDWQTEGWKEGPEYSTYQWNHEEGQPGELSVTNLQPNDARWSQSLTLGPGWYHFGADLRAEKVGKDNTGASLSVLEDGITSPDLKGSTGWQRVGFYLKIPKRGADIELACRVGGYGSLNTGTVFCRHITLERIAAPPARAESQFDLEQIRKENAEVPIGSPWTLVATFLMLGVVSYIGWHYFGAAIAPSPAQDRQSNEAPTDRKTAS